MKKTFLKILCMIIAVVMITAAFAACEPAGPTDTTTEPGADNTTGGDVTTAEETTAEETTAEETTTPVPAPAEGLLVYRQDFDVPNLAGTDLVLPQIGWTRLTKEADGVYNETNANFSIVDGRLYYQNIGEGIDGKDGYYQIDMLNDAYMQQVCAGKYTLQYDLEYVEVGNGKRYAVITTEASADGQNYNSFHLRALGYGNHQCHWVGEWQTYNALPAKTDNSVPSIGEKLTGTPYDANNNILLNKKLTIKLQWDPEAGHTVYVKLEGGEFVKVSEPDPEANGVFYHNSWEGWNVRFKIGAQINGYIDNIVLWTGWGDMPTATTPDYTPAPLN